MHAHTSLRQRALAIAAAGFAAAALALPAHAQNVKLGALMPLTGGLAQYGEADLRGITLAAMHINAQGGVLGRTLEILIGDTQTNPQAGVSAAQNLVRVQNVTGLIGALASGVTIPVATSVSAVDGVPQISSASTAPGISTLADNDFLFRTVPHDAAQGEVLGTVAREGGYARVAVLYVNNDYGKGLADAFAASFAAQGGTVTASVPYEEGQASYRGELQRAAQGTPEALVHIAYPGDGIPQIRQALEEGFFTKFVFSDGMKSTEMVEQFGEFLEGAVGTAAESVESPASIAFRDAYNGQFGELPPLPYIDTAYDAAFILALAIQKAGTSADRTAVRDALRSVANAPGIPILPGEWAKAVQAIAAGQDIDYVGAAGSQDFDANGDVPGSVGVWTIRDGEIVTTKIVG